jgi:hypothetical protein
MHLGVRLRAVKSSLRLRCSRSMYRRALEANCDRATPLLFVRVGTGRDSLAFELRRKR